MRVLVAIVWAMAGAAMRSGKRVSKARRMIGLSECGCLVLEPLRWALPDRRRRHPAGKAPCPPLRSLYSFHVRRILIFPLIVLAGLAVEALFRWSNGLALDWS